MDRQIKNCPTNNLTSLEGHYTDFDQWVVSFTRYTHKRSQPEVGIEENPKVPISVSWQHLLVTGFQKENGNEDFKKIFTTDDSFKLKHIFKSLLNESNIYYHYTKSKL